jgi:hypothetical protein
LLRRHAFPLGLAKKRSHAVVPDTGKLLTIPPDIAGETIVRGIERRESRVLVGSDAKAISLIARLLPVSYWKLLARRVEV